MTTRDVLRASYPLLRASYPQGKYAITTAVPGDARSNEPGETTQPGANLGRDNVHRLGITLNDIVAEAHTHTRFGDPEQRSERDFWKFGRHPGGLSASSGGQDGDGDFEYAARHPGRRQFLVNQRGEVREFFADRVARKPLRSGISSEEARGGGAFGAVKAARSANPNFNEILDDAAYVLLRPGLRNDLLRQQRQVN